ncbi:hypothetical protein LBMAG53_35620 [Planctomycetota bacterium]|nr:hypothetical protein LBMAG53_35620 [Planctomycetota bacterium]
MILIPGGNRAFQIPGAAAQADIARAAAADYGICGGGKQKALAFDEAGGADQHWDLDGHDDSRWRKDGPGRTYERGYG